MTILQVAFIVLKLCGVIAWPWVWVLAPLWIGVIIAILWVAIQFLFVWRITK